MYNYIAFTDGSAIKNKNDIWIGGTGTIVLDLKNCKMYDKSESLYDSTSNYSELYSVKLALGMIEKLSKKKGNIKILIISDSKYTCEGLGINVHKWAAGKTRTDNWKNSSGTLCNQELIKYIYYNYLEDSKYDINFLHMNSHLNENDNKNINMVISKTHKQGFNVDKETVKTMIRYNRKADEMSYDAADKGSKSEVI